MPCFEHPHEASIRGTEWSPSEQHSEKPQPTPETRSDWEIKKQGTTQCNAQMGAAARLSGRGVGYVSTGQPVWYYLRLWGYWMSGTILGFGNPRCP
eukprot:1601805-Rhodomonas_salina.1